MMGLPNRGERPRRSRLILTHILQTEVKSKMSALKKGLQQEPAFPDGSPARRTIVGTCQIASHSTCALLSIWLKPCIYTHKEGGFFVPVL